MSIKIVSCDLKGPRHYYRSLINAIEMYENVKMTDSFWFVNTEEDCDYIYKNLEIYLNDGDRLLIQDLKGEELVGSNLLSTEEQLQNLFKLNSVTP